MSKRPRKHRKAFDAAAYRKHTDEVWQKRMASFEGLVLKAASKSRRKRDPQPLIDYFRYGGPRQLSEQDCQNLAWFLERVLPRPRHRPRGTVKPKNVALHDASYLLRYAKRLWRRSHDYQQMAFHNAIDRLTKRAIELVEQESPSVAGQLSAEAVRDFNKPIHKNEVEASLGDFLPLAMAEMKREALQ